MSLSFSTLSMPETRVSLPRCRSCCVAHPRQPLNHTRRAPAVACALYHAALLTRSSCSVGTDACPAASLWGRISVARSLRHRSLDVSIEYEPRGSDGVARPELRQTQLFEV